MNLDPHYTGILANYPKKPWQKFINQDNSHLCNTEALDLLSKMLVYDHAERILPKEAMLHDYFAPVREYHSKKEKEWFIPSLSLEVYKRIKLNFIDLRLI